MDRNIRQHGYRILRPHAGPSFSSWQNKAGAGQGLCFGKEWLPQSSSPYPVWCRCGPHRPSSVGPQHPSAWGPHPPSLMRGHRFRLGKVWQGQARGCVLEKNGFPNLVLSTRCDAAAARCGAAADLIIHQHLDRSIRQPGDRMLRPSCGAIAVVLVKSAKSRPGAVFWRRIGPPLLVVPPLLTIVFATGKVRK